MSIKKKSNDVSAEIMVINKHLEIFEKSLERQDLKADQIIKENLVTHKELAEMNASMRLMNETSLKQEENLRAHMARTKLLENRVAPLETFVNKAKIFGIVAGVALTLVAWIVSNHDKIISLIEKIKKSI